MEAGCRFFVAGRFVYNRAQAAMARCRDGDDDRGDERDSHPSFRPEGHHSDESGRV